MKNKKSKNIFGFTLVELVIVMGIIGIMATFAIPKYFTYQARAKTTEANINLRTMYVAVKSKFATGTPYSSIAVFVAAPNQVLTGFGIEGPARYNYVGNGTNDKRPCDAFGCDKTTDLSSPCPGTKGVAWTTNGFIGTAWGQIDVDYFMDLWTIDTNGKLFNTNATGVNADGSGMISGAMDACSDVVYPKP